MPMLDPAFDPGAAAAPDSGIFGLPASLTPDQAGVVLVPVPFEATCSYGGGTRRGPEAILAASRQVDLYDLDTGHPYQAGIVMLPQDPQLAAWDDEARGLALEVIAGGGSPDAVAQVNELCTRMNAWVEGAVREHLDAGKRVGVVGGDHSVAFGSVAAHAARYPGLGLLHVDAHADLRRAYEGFTFSHASVMRNVVDRLEGVQRLVQVGLRDLSEEEHALAHSSGGRIVQHTDSALSEALEEGIAWRTLCQRMVEVLPERVYVSFDIDGLDPALCPHTGTPVPGGMSFRQAVGLLREVVRSGRRIVGFDLTEVTPGPEGDEWDANVGARVLYKLIGFSGMAGARR